MKSFSFGLPYGGGMPGRAFIDAICEMLDDELEAAAKKVYEQKYAHTGGAHRTVPGSALNTDDRASDQGSTPYPPSNVKRVIDL